MPRLCLALAAALVLTGCGDEGSTPLNVEGPSTDFFVDVTESHLPDLSGASMDASSADVDGDGDLDLIIAHEHRPNVLLINDGAGRFTDESDARLPRQARDSEDVVTTDFDADGDTDAFIVSEDDEENEFYLNDGTGQFQDASARIPVTGTTNAVVVAFLNRDRYPDLVLGNNGQNVVLLGDGEGGFIEDTEGRLPRREDVTQDMEYGDVDGDTYNDLIFGNEGDNRLLLGDEDGFFEEAPAGMLPLREAGEETREVDLGDVDGDGDLDLVFANIQFQTEGADPQNRLLINDRGTFTDETADRLPADSSHSFDAELWDVDGDGDLDLITASTRLGGEPEPYRVFLNDGDGVFTDATTDIFPSSVVGYGFDIESADFNGDGRPDLFLAGRGTQDRLLLRR